MTTGTLESGTVDETALGAVIERAKRIVGENGDKNFNLFLERPCDFERRHVSPLRHHGPEAEALVKCLTSRPVITAINEYREDDASALIEQAAYRTKTRRIALPMFIALAVAVLLAIVRPEGVIWFVGKFLKLDPAAAETFQRLWYQFMPWVVLLGLIANALMQFLLSPLKNYNDWMTARATAEALRREIFRRIMAEPLPASEADKAWPLLLRLEYFRRWQAQVQHAYFLRQRARHMRTIAGDRRAKWCYVAAMAALFGFLLLSLIASRDEQGASAFVPLFVSGLLSKVAFVETWGLDYVLLLVVALTGALWFYFFFNARLENSVRQAARFATMERNFKDILGEEPGGRLYQARMAAAKGNERAVREYMVRVHSMMSLELNDWVRLSELDQGNDRATYRPAEPAAAASGTAS